MILICGGLADPVVELVCARLSDCKYAYRLVDLGVYPAGFEVCWHWVGDSPTGYFATADWRLDLHEVSGVYVRYPSPQQRAPVPSIKQEFAPAVYAECATGLSTLLEHLPCTVVNRLTGGMSVVSL
jgi:hypothetical protein